MFGLQPTHLIAILVVALLVFGPQRLPEIGRALGKSINEFKNATKEMTDSFSDEVKKSDNNVVHERVEETKS